MCLEEKRKLLCKTDQNEKYVDYDKSKYKINAYFIHSNNLQECYREQMVSYFPMLPLLEEQVRIEEADYILYCHAYARCEDMSHVVLKELKYLDSIRKPGAEIIVVGKAANAERLLNGSIKNITFWMSHFTEKLGKKFGLDIKEQYFVWDDEKKWLAIWPVDGCLRKCHFCRRSYMYIPFESLSLETIRQNLDFIRDTEPEKLKTICLRAENLTEYGIDIYGKPYLDKLIDLINSYEEVENITIQIGMCISEITPEILDALCRCNKLHSLYLNLEAGSNRLLRTIGKPHTVEDAIYIYKRLRESHPDIWIGSLVMIGLPTEEMTDIFALAELIYITQPDFVKCNYYSWAPGQPIANLPQISKPLREYHLKILLKQLRYARRDLLVCHEMIFKNKNSRKAIKMLEELKRDNETQDFPGILTTYTAYTEK